MRIPRKMEHIYHALRLGQSGNQGLDDIRLVPNALPGASVESVTLNTRIGELDLSSPILINAMTGGAPETEKINRELAAAARECGVAMAVGSQMSAFKDKAMRDSYRIVRRINPKGIVLANLGSEATLAQAREAVEMIEADGLQIHLNVMQELIMPEGDRDFRGMTERIAAIANGLTVPVIVKEVGFGIMAEAARQLAGCGIRILDVGGAGGTNFAAIENARRDEPLLWLNDWGVKTSIALLETLHAFQGDVIASGGIRSAMEAAKVLAAGASAVGMAGALLRVLQEQGTASLIRKIGELHDDLKLIMTALGASTVAELRQRPVVIKGETREWCAERGIDTAKLARRALGNRIAE